MSNQLSGPDYLIGAAQHLQETSMDYTRDAGEREQILFNIHAFQEFIMHRVVEGQGFPRGTELDPREIGALMVLREAIGVSLERQDRQSLQELVSWGLGVTIEFLRK
jgi:hypothetical protein